MGGYSKGDAARDTGTSTGKTSEAWHQARDDSGVRSGRDVDSFKSAPSWARDAKTDSGISLFPSRTESHSSGK